MRRCGGTGFVLLVVGGCLWPIARGAQENDVNTGTIKGKVVSPWIWGSEAVVYITKAPGRFEPPAQDPVLDQRRMRFIPHVLPVLVGSTVAFPNNDTVQHSVYSPPYSVKQFNLGMYPSGVTKRVTYDRVGVVPLLCNVHSEMSAFVVVLPNPYFAVTDVRGNFAIKNVPAGSYRLTFWHERLKPQTLQIDVKAGDMAEVTFRDPKKGPFYSIELTKPESE